MNIFSEKMRYRHQGVTIGFILRFFALLSQSFRFFFFAYEIENFGWFLRAKWCQLERFADILSKRHPSFSRWLFNSPFQLSRGNCLVFCKRTYCARYMQTDCLNWIASQSQLWGRKLVFINNKYHSKTCSSPRI